METKDQENPSILDFFFWIGYWFPSLVIMLVTWASWVNPERRMEEHGFLQQKQCSRACYACAFMTDDRWKWWQNDSDEMAMMNDDGQMMVDEYLVKHKNAHAFRHLPSFILLINIYINNNIFSHWIQHTGCNDLWH